MARRAAAKAKEKPAEKLPQIALPNKQKKKAKQGGNLLLLLPSVFFFIFFSAHVFAPQTIESLPSYLQQLQQILSSQKKYPPSVLPSLQLSPTIETVTWEESLTATAVLKQIIQKSVPVVIRQGPAAAWPISKWDLLDILKSGNDLVMERMRWQREPVFILGRDRDEGGMLGSESDQPLQYVNSSLSEFLKTLFDPSQYLYWSGELSWIEEVTGTSATKSKTNPSIDWSIFKYVDPLLEDSLQDREDELWVPMIWLSHPGVVAQTHYDPQHNFLSQLQGSKRVILFPPTEPSMYLFPHIHRSYRQSQLPLELIEAGEGATARDKLFPSLPQSGIEVVLHPGDSLYIPPYWFHRIEALTMSISISVTSPSIEEAQFSEVYWQTLPLGPFTNSTEGRMIGAKIYLGLLIHLLQSELKDSLRSFSEELYLSRYRPLFPDLGQSDLSIQCPSYPTEESYYGRLIQENSNALHSVATKSAEALKAIQCDVAVKKNFLRDYVEELSRWAVGAAQTASFIRECLR